MYRKRMQHLAEMNLMGVLSITRVLDVGASDGYWSLFASRLFPTAKFFLIDGNPYLQKTLQDTGLAYDISVVGSDADAERGRLVKFVDKFDGIDGVDEVDGVGESGLGQWHMTTIDDVVF
jgi:hypothetical protein